MKQNAALRGRNGMRNNRSNSATKRAPPLDRHSVRGGLCLDVSLLGTGADASENPGGAGAEPRTTVNRSADQHCRSVFEAMACAAATGWGDPAWQVSTRSVIQFLPTSWREVIWYQ